MSSISPSTSTINDNPCWGGPTHHNLEYLLHVLSSSKSTSTPEDETANDRVLDALYLSSPEKYATFIKRIHEKLIIYQDDNYIAINKPADLRMDGAHEATVHKLLLYLFPPPSLLQNELDTMNTTKDGDDIGSRDGDRRTSSCLEKHKQLLQSIAPLSLHSSLKDDPHRMVHQLDYATSGVLLVGRNKKSTAAACRSFEQRKTNKQYVAVVINPLSSSSATINSQPPLGEDFFDSLPTLPPSSLDSWGDGSLEKRYRKKRQRDTNDRDDKRKAFDGYMPVHSVFDKWRAKLIRQKKEAKTQPQQSSNDQTTTNTEEQTNKKRKKQQHLPPLPDPKVELTLHDIDELLSLGSSWKAVKSKCNASGSGINWIDILETMTESYNQSLEQYYATKSTGGESKVSSDTEEEGKGEKKIATANDNLPPLFRIQGDLINAPNVFYICASIGEYKDGRFDVAVDPAAVKSKVTKIDTTTEHSPPLPELKPSLTKCTVLWRGYMNSNNERIPVTKVLLKPWTGRRHQLRVHMSYVAGFPILGDVTYGGNLTSSLSHERSSICRRMCLHAKELTIPLIGNETKTFVAPDPFLTTKIDCEDETLMIL